MILYFADRQLNILGHASTELPEGLTVVEDQKTEDIETGIAVFECKLPFNRDTRTMVEECAAVGNYILRSHDQENEFYTIIDAEIDTKNQEVYIYAEDAGLDLLNEVCGPYEADAAYPIDHYINKFAYDSGFEIGINEASGLTRKLSWDGNATATERIASVATQFGGYEISYSYQIYGLEITKKCINIFKERGQDNGVQLRLNKEVDRIITKRTIKNLATALECVGGTPEGADEAITLDGYKYDDGDFYVSGSRLYSREALKKWSRYNWTSEPNQLADNEGHIVAQFYYDTDAQSTLFAHALTELKRINDIEENYEIELTELPEGTKVGDWVNIVDDEGNSYVSARILLLETSVADQRKQVTLGEYLIRNSGISQKVTDLAAQFAKTTQSTARALAIASSSAGIADEAVEQAAKAATSAANAQSTANDAAAIANAAQQAAQAAQTAANNAQTTVQNIEREVEALEITVGNAQAAADNAQTAATTAQTKAEEAKTAANEAKAAANEVQESLSETQTKADEAFSKAETAQSTAATAKSEAETAKETAEAAKADAEQAKQDVAALGEELETLSSTMVADYARKTDLTATEAHLQSQISQNAAMIESLVSSVTTIDETENSAEEQAREAKETARSALLQAGQAIAAAQAAQTAANNATTAAATAQSEAETAKTAAATAQSVADKAQADLEAAQADLATVSSRVDATEEDIVAAQQAVTAAQTAANTAKADAEAAAQNAANAQATANTAVTNAANAKTAADNAASNAALAKKTADEAKGNASAAQARAEEAASSAAEAQATANTAVANASDAKATANAAAQAAADAQSAAEDAEARAAQAEADLATAQQNLAAVTSRVDATEAEVADAQAAVVTAKNAADKAKEEAEAAQATADTAKANAATAQTTANNAKTAADEAQQAAEDAQRAADEAQAAVDALAVRVTTAETKITQSSEQIALMAKKTEVAEMLGGYSTKDETEAAITLESDSIKASVSETYSTKTETNERITSAESLVQQLSNCISLLVTDENGESLMTQTENGWTFNMAQISGTLDSATADIDALTESLGGVDNTVNSLKQSLADLGILTDYVVVTTYNGQPCIELGESENNFKLRITNTEIQFVDGTAIPAYVSNKKLMIEQAEVKDEMQFGGFVWKIRSNGNMGLMWKGVTS